MTGQGARATVAVVGLSAMGASLARNLASREAKTVAIYNRSPDMSESLVRARPEAGFVQAATYAELAASLQTPRTAIFTVKAGAGTDALIDRPVEVFEPGDIIVDGGNALFTDTIRREAADPCHRHLLRGGRHLRRRRGSPAGPPDHACHAWRVGRGMSRAPLLTAPCFVEALTRAQRAWRRTVQVAAAAGVPVPAFSSALSNDDGLRAQRLPASLVQGQRDFFGEHTYRCVHEQGSFHTLWSGDRDGIQAEAAG